MLVLHVRSKLNLGLDAAKLAGFVERHGVRAVEDVVSGLGTAPGREGLLVTGESIGLGQQVF